MPTIYNQAEEERLRARLGTRTPGLFAALAMLGWYWDVPLTNKSKHVNWRYIGQEFVVYCRANNHGLEPEGEKRVVSWHNGSKTVRIRPSPRLTIEVWQSDHPRPETKIGIAIGHSIYKFDNTGTLEHIPPGILEDADVELVARMEAWTQANFPALLG